MSFKLPACREGSPKALREKEEEGTDSFSWSKSERLQFRHHDAKGPEARFGEKLPQQSAAIEEGVPGNAEICRTLGDPNQEKAAL